jgi:hypothetical protein
VAFLKMRLRALRKYPSEVRNKSILSRYDVPHGIGFTQQVARMKRSVIRNNQRHACPEFHKALSSLTESTDYGHAPVEHIPQCQFSHSNILERVN